MGNNQKTAVVNCDSLIDQFEGNLYCAGVKFDYFYPVDRLCDNYNYSIKELFELEVNERVDIIFRWIDSDLRGLKMSCLMNPTDVKLFLTLSKEELSVFFSEHKRRALKNTQ